MTSENYLARILILGSGMVSRPGIDYLLEQGNLFVTVASDEPEEARKMIAHRNNGCAVPVDASDENRTAALVEEHDIVVSLLPHPLHPGVARLCLRYGKHLATASYVDEQMRSLDREIKAKNLIFLNEMGVDPGIDHMSAMKIIDMIAVEGGKVIEFHSYCGGLPAPEDNDNPFGYKFSWSPKGVLTAGRNPARYLENGLVREIKGDDLFAGYWTEEIRGLGVFEVYPNRDSLPYKDIYGLTDARTVVRGTYRYPGWCDTLKAMVDLKLLEENPRPCFKNMTFKGLMDKLLANTPNFKFDPAVRERFEWLGLFSDRKIPPDLGALDILAQLMLNKLYYKNEEKDMLLMRHRFVVENSDGCRDLIISTMIEFGRPGGDTAMARTVGTPLAIGVKLMAEKKINTTGVIIPTAKEIYDPVLRELDRLGIRLTETRTPLGSEFCPKK